MANKISKSTQISFERLVKRAVSVKRGKTTEEKKEERKAGIGRKPRGKVVLGDKRKNDWMMPKKGRRI